MLISYCCRPEKVRLHLFSWPCLQWMSSYFAFLTNLPFYESVPNNSYCKRLLLSRWWNVWNTIRFGTKTCHDRTFFLLKKTIIPCTYCTFWKNYAISARTHKTVILTLELFSSFQISSLYGTDAYSIDITANQMICIG